MDRRLRIAVADDEELVRRYLGEVLPELGHEVVASAADGPELAEQVRTTRPDLVITDIRMPNRDGGQTVREICRTMAIPVVFVTGLPLECRPVLSGCIHLILTKPIDREALQDGISRVMSLFRQAYGLPPASGAGGHDIRT